MSLFFTRDELAPSLKNPVVRVADILKTEPSRHISFHAPQTPDRPHTNLPVTPNTGRYLSAPVQPSPAPAGATPFTVKSGGGGAAKRRIAFITLSDDPMGKGGSSTTTASSGSGGDDKPAETAGTKPALSETKKE